MKHFLAVFALAAWLVSCSNKSDLNIQGRDESWIADTSKATIFRGDNYLLAINRTSKPKSILGEIESSAAVSMMQTFEGHTKALGGMRTFSVEIEKDEFLRYLANMEEPENPITSFRVYFGAYPSGSYRNRFTAMLVAVAKDGTEKYEDGQPGRQIVNIGTMCPTNCPRDSRSIYVRAGSPNP